MNTLSLLVLAIAGYWFLTRTYWTYHRFIRLTGYHILFGSAFCGALLYGASFVITDLAFGSFSPCALATWVANSPPLFNSTAQVSIALAAVLPLLINKFFREDAEGWKSAQKHGDEIELTLRGAHNRNRLVEVTLRNRKSYIGFPRDFGNGSVPDSDISIVPVYSGYRCEDTSELKLTQDYRPALFRTLSEDHAVPNWKVDDFQGCDSSLGGRYLCGCSTTTCSTTSGWPSQLAME